MGNRMTEVAESAAHMGLFAAPPVTAEATTSRVEVNTPCCGWWCSPSTPANC